MKRTLSSALLICAIIGGAISLPTIAAAPLRPAKCHDNEPAPPPQPANHDCCAIGHVHALPTQAVQLRNSTALTVVAIAVTVELTRPSCFTAKEFFMDDASPPDSSPLRI